MFSCAAFLCCTQRKRAKRRSRRSALWIVLTRMETAGRPDLPRSLSLPFAQREHRNARDQCRDTDDGRKVNRMVFLLSRLNRTHIDDFLLRGVCETLVAKRDYADYDQQNRENRAASHGVSFAHLRDQFTYLVAPRSYNGWRRSSDS